jgi:SH3 domain-containing YSC84-like protein 1
VKKLLLFIAFSLLSSYFSIAADKISDRVVSAARVLKEISEAPDKGIPKDLLDKSSCVAIIPGTKKLAFVGGISYGRGVISCRIDDGTGAWSAPSMMMLGGGSFGAQAGVQSADLVLVIMNLSGLESLLNSKFTLGGDASVAAGPVGRTAAAETDAWMSAKILTYSRSSGLFAGVAIKGSTIKPDKKANKTIYGKEVEPREILLHKTDSIPKDVQIFLDELTKISPKKESNKKQSK